MPHPTQRHTKSRRNKRRLHLRLSPIMLTSCAKCGRAVLPHHVCQWCGTYRGREAINVLAKLDKKERKKKERELAEAEPHEKETEPPQDLEKLSVTP